MTDPDQSLEHEIIERVMRMMNWSRQRAYVWYGTENPLLAGVAPVTVVKAGGSAKVMALVQGECGR